MVAGPFMPLPPGRFSITTGWPRCFAAISPSLRRCRSVPPPAGQGQISVIGLAGKVCACAAEREQQRRRPARIFVFMRPPPSPRGDYSRAPAARIRALLDSNRSDLVAGVAGTGTMGRGIVQVLAQCGARTLVFDAQPGAARKAQGRDRPERWASWSRKAASRPPRSTSHAGRIEIVDSLEEPRALPRGGRGDRRGPGRQARSCSPRWKRS